MDHSSVRGGMAHPGGAGSGGGAVLWDSGSADCGQKWRQVEIGSEIEAGGSQ